MNLRTQSYSTRAADRWRRQILDAGRTGGLTESEPTGNVQFEGVPTTGVKSLRFPPTIRMRPSRKTVAV